MALRLTVQVQLVVQALLRDPAREMYGLELSEETGLQPGTAYPILLRLEHEGGGACGGAYFAPGGARRRARGYHRLRPWGGAPARAAVGGARRPTGAALRRLAEGGGTA